MFTETITIQTRSSFSCHSITENIRNILISTKQLEGIITVFSKHTTTAIIVNEMEERLIMDLEKWVKELVPPAEGYKHDDLHLRVNIPIDEPKNAHSHLQALLLGNDITLPFKNGQLQLGKYQDVILVELDGPRKRKVVISIL